MKTFAQPRSIASMLVEPPVVAPPVDMDGGVPVLDLPTMDLPGAPAGAGELLVACPRYDRWQHPFAFSCVTSGFGE